MPAPRPSSVACLSPGGFHRMAFLDWGAETARRPVVCVHGLTRNAHDFDTLAAALAAQGRRVVCPDVVGRGASERLADPSGYGYPQYMADMTALIARLDAPEIDWVGTSMGGLIGMMLAAQKGTPIRRLVVNDVGPFIPEAALARIATYLGADPLFSDFGDAERFIRTVHGPFGDLSDAQWRALTESSVRQIKDGGYRLRYDPAIAEAFKARPIEDVDLWPVWDAIACPTLVLRGAESYLLLPDTAREMTTRGPRAEVVEIAGCGHAPALMDAAQIALVQDWLERP